MYLKDTNAELIDKIRAQKFQWHNAEWLQCISRHAEDHDSALIDEDTSSMYEKDAEQLEFENRLSIGGTRLILNSPTC